MELLIAQFWPYIVGLVVAFGGYFGIRQAGKSAGRQETRQEINEAEAVARKEARNVEIDTAAMADSDIDDDLAKWVRGKR